MTRWPPRPRLSSTFFKGHGLGNDYLVFTVDERGWSATPRNVSRVCDRYRGAGADGIVVAPAIPPSAAEEPWALRMFNPDGSEFERSGNGLRVFGAWVATVDPLRASVSAEVAGELVGLVLHGREGSVHDVSVEMGRAKVGPGAVDMTPGFPGGTESVEERIEGPDGTVLALVPVSVGNPHLVVLSEGGTPVRLDDGVLGRLGPFLTGHPSLAHGANVQLASVVGEQRCRALIWERGVGRTSASGTSACAVAVAMVSTGRSRPGDVRVDMPGGALDVSVSDGLEVVLRGPVEAVMEGRLLDPFLATFEPGP